MNTAWKYLVLVGGLAGILGFFLPFAKARNEELKMEKGVSGYDIVKGIDRKELLAEAEGIKASKEDVERAADEIEHGLKEAGGFVLAFYSPAAALALLGIFGVLLKRYGRLAGFGAFLFGACSAGIWFLFHTTAAKQVEHGSQISLGIGIHMLLVAGLCGVAAGLGALFAPDRG